jgi:hypothetical protein
MPHSLGTYRSVLVRLGGCTCRSTNPFPGSRASRPYNSFEVAALWSMAQHQPSSLRIANAKVALATMVGAGLHPGELAELCGQDVQSRRGQCRAPYGQELLGLAKREKGYLFRPGARVRSAKNLIGEVCAALVRDHDEVALSARRARSTFICAHLRARTPLHMLCAMAGIVEVESLLRYARHVEGAPGSKAALRAEARRS